MVSAFFISVIITILITKKLPFKRIPFSFELNYQSIRNHGLVFIVR